MVEEMAARVTILALTICVALLLAAPGGSSEPNGFRATMVRRETTINFTQAVGQSHRRLMLLASRVDAASSGTTAQTPLRPDGAGYYNMEISIGTPPQKFWALADTGSDLIWAKCSRCASCTPKDSPSYNPAKSSTFSKLPCSNRLCVDLKSQNQASCGAGGAQCDYRFAYGFDSKDYVQGYMGNDTFTLGNDAVKGVGFGCTTMWEGTSESGLVGLSRGSLSLVSQLNVSAFSYCLTDDPSKASPLLFGSVATLTGPGVQSTRFLGNTPLYNVNLTTITIGSATAPGTGRIGLIFDSGATITYLAEPTYTAAKRAILSQTSLPRVADRYGYEACFRASGNNPYNHVPTMVLNFEGADMKLPAKNYFQQVNSGVICWMVQSSDSLSIIGNIMQRNYHIRYDIDKKVLSFQQANCNSI